MLHVDAAVRVDNASTYAVAQAMPKLEEGAAPCGFVVAVGAVVSGAAETSRCRRRTSSALSEFTLPDFPPGKCEVLTPRIQMDDTWLRVAGHREGKLIVRNEDGEEETLSLHTVNRLFAKGKAIKRMLLEEEAPPPRRVVRRLALQEPELGQQDEAEQEGEDNYASGQPPQPPQPPQPQQPPEPPQPPQPQEAVKTEDETGSTSTYGKRKLFSRKHISEVIGGNFMHAPWVPTNPTGKGPRRPQDEHALLAPGEMYVVDGGTWAPHLPSVAMQPGALRHWNADGIRAEIESGRGLHQKGALQIISPPVGQDPASFQFFAKRQDGPARYEYCGKYTMAAFDEECEYENPENFSKERVRELMQQSKSHGRFESEASRKDRLDWIKDKATWKLRIITPESYNEELYQRLVGIA